MFSKEERLSTAIDEVRSGRSTVETELGRHPELKSEEPLLLLGAAIHAPADAVLTPAVRRQTRAMLMEEARAKGVTNHPFGRILWLRNPFNQRRASMPAILSMIVALGLALGGGGIFAAQAAVPGDALFPLKAGLEQAQVARAQGDEALIRTHLDLAERRLDEIEARHSELNHEAEGHIGANAFNHLEQAAQAIERFTASGHDAGEHQARLGVDRARYDAWQARFGRFESEAEHPQGIGPRHQPENDQVRDHDQARERDQLRTSEGEHRLAPSHTPEPEHQGWQQGQPAPTHEPEREQHQGTMSPTREPQHNWTPAPGQTATPHEPELQHQSVSPVPSPVAPAPWHEQEGTPAPMHQYQQPAPAPTSVAPVATAQPHQEPPHSGSSGSEREGRH